MGRAVIGCCALLLASASANAAWHEVSSDHFVIYSDQSPKVTQRFAERLERFQAAMSVLFARAKEKPAPSNRVTVFVLPSAAQVRKVSGVGNRFAAGLYRPRAGSSVALVPRLNHATHDFSGERVLYHEYAHHFMATNLTSRAFPRWLNEGFAEFFSTARFSEDGNVMLGAPAMHRGAELMWAPEVPMRAFLDFDGGWRDRQTTFNSFYGQSWLLFHYLFMSSEREGQFNRYQQLLAQGRTALEAAEGAFGDLVKLERDMDRYVRSRTWRVVNVAGNRLEVGAIVVRELRPGEAEMMPIIIESRAGVTQKEALALLPEARRIAALHPTDATVLAALAEAEFDAGNDAAAIAAADSALAIDPKQINAHLQKGYALRRQAESGGSTNVSWKDVRAQFIRANAADNDHPIPLVQFYLTYLKQRERPTQNAIEGLEAAMLSAPFDHSLRWLVVQQMISDRRYAQAAKTLAPLAYSPHPGPQVEAARKLLTEVEGRIESQQVASPESLETQ